MSLLSHIPDDEGQPQTRWVCYEQGTLKYQCWHIWHEGWPASACNALKLATMCGSFMEEQTLPLGCPPSTHTSDKTCKTCLKNVNKKPPQGPPPAPCLGNPQCACTRHRQLRRKQ